MKLIVGLGNPGEKYERTRHNIGFEVIKKVAEKMKDSDWKEEANAHTLNGQIGGEKVVLALPQTYMNRSGIAVKKMSNKYQQKEESIIVIHDDIDLPFSQIKVRKGGGAGGHNGIQSIFDETQMKDFIRVRIGIGRPQTQSWIGKILGQKKVSDYVLQEFSKVEQKELPRVIEEAASKTYMLAKFGYEEFTSKYNRSPTTPRQ